VTGVRFAAAAAITLRPTAVEPVKIRWSKGSRLNSAATSGPPCTTSTSSAANQKATSRASSALNCGVISDGLTSTRLPAASATASGATDRYSG